MGMPNLDNDDYLKILPSQRPPVLDADDEHWLEPWEEDALPRPFFAILAVLALLAASGLAAAFFFGVPL